MVTQFPCHPERSELATCPCHPERSELANAVEGSRTWIITGEIPPLRSFLAQLALSLSNGVGMTGGCSKLAPVGMTRMGIEPLDEEEDIVTLNRRHFLRGS